MTTDLPPAEDPRESHDDVSISVDVTTPFLRSRVLDPPSRPGLIACLDRFEILRLVCEGGMGAVFLAQDPLTNSRVAIKILKPEYWTNSRAVDRFLAEARHMGQLSHPHILPVLEVSKSTDRPYFITPFMERGSLSDLLIAADEDAQSGTGDPRSGRASADSSDGKPVLLDSSAVLRIALQVAEALTYAHDRGIIHRDLKPANVLLDAEGRAHLADFGLGRTTLTNESLVDLSTAPCEGTAAYIAPEVAQGRAGDFRCDVYGFGAVLYELLTGRAPYSGPSAQEVLTQVRTESPTPIRELNPKAPDRLAVIAGWAMARELRDRYAHMADVLADLHRIESGRAPLGPRGHRRRRPIQVVQSLIPVLIGLNVCLLALSLVGRQSPGEASSTKVIRPSPPAEFTVTLFDDDFPGSRLNPSLWTWVQSHEPSIRGLGSQCWEVRQERGSLWLKVEAESTDGWTARQQLQLDSTQDLKGKGTVAVDMRLSLQGTLASQPVHGALHVLLHDKVLENPAGMPAGVRLHETTFDRVWPAKPRELTLSFILHDSSGLAEVWSSDPAQPMRLIDISSLTQWRLQFYLGTSTASGYPPGNIQLRLDRVMAHQTSGNATIAGFVTDAVTLHAVPDAEISCAPGESGRSNAAGVYLLDVQPQAEYMVQARKDGYAPASRPAFVYPLIGEQRRVDIRLKRVRFEYGDPIEALPLPTGPFPALLATETGLMLAVREEPQAAYLFYTDLRGSEPIRGPRVPFSVAGLTRHNGRIFLINNDRPAVYEVHADQAPEMLFTLPSRYASGLAHDGERLWYLEMNNPDNRFELIAVEPTTGRPLIRVESPDRQLCYVTFADHRLWIASEAGKVLEVDLKRVLTTRSLPASVIREFSGTYWSIAHAAGYLWGSDLQTGQLLRINLQETPQSQPTSTASSRLE